MSDVDPTQAASLDDLAKCLKELHRQADRPALRQLETRTRHAKGVLPGTTIERIRLRRTLLSEVLRGQKLPTKAFLLTFVEALGVNLEADRRWEEAWNRLDAHYQDQSRESTDDEFSHPTKELRQQQPGQTVSRDHDVLPVGRKRAVFDPDVIEWRLEVAPRFPMRSLTELRQAIEPVAASLAAERASEDVCRDLVSLSRQLQELGEDNRFEQKDQAGGRIREDYRVVDVRFHRALLKESQNEMFDALADPVEKALNFRIQRDSVGARGPGAGAGGNQRFPKRPEPLALWLHRGLAAAVQHGRQSAAETFSRAILAEVRTAQLPPLICIALEHALEDLDPTCMGTDSKDWEQFEEAIRAAIRRNTEAGS